MRNESPVGLATFLGVAPAIIAGVVFVGLLVKSGGDVEQATQLTLAVIGGVSLVGTAALRQWRAVVEAKPPPVVVASSTGPSLPPGGEEV